MTEQFKKVIVAASDKINKLNAMDNETHEAQLAKEVDEAMQKTGGYGRISYWWADEEIMTPLYKGIKKGWVLKLSTTQIQYTDKAEQEMFPLLNEK